MTKIEDPLSYAGYRTLLVDGKLTNYHPKCRLM